MSINYAEINVGTVANDGTGDSLRASFVKINSGFANLNSNLGNTLVTSTISADTISATGNITGGNLTISSNADITGNVTVGNILADNITTIESQISALEANSHATLASNVTTLEGNITTLEGNVTTLEGNITTLEGNVTTLDNQVANLNYYNDSNVATYISSGDTIDITIDGNISGNVNGYSIGYLEIPQIVLSSDANIELTDSGKHYYSTTASNLNLLIPTNSDTALPIGSTFTVVVQASGNVLVNADTGVTLYHVGNITSGNRVVGPYGMATIMKVDSDTWFINGYEVS